MICRLLTVCCSSCIAVAAEPPAAGSVSFSREVAPVLQQKCVTCHGPEKSKGGYQLHTFESLMKSGESKEAPVVPGEPERSHLYRLLVTKDDDDRMPQKDDPVPASQVEVIARWIKEGARFDGADIKAPLTTLSPPANHPAPPAAYERTVPVLAMAFGAEGKMLAVGGYHEVTLWNPSDGALLRRITNITLQTHALAFSPDGSLLAAGGGVPGRAGEAKLMDPQSGSILKTMAITTDCLLALAFSPDGRRLLIGGADNAIRIFDVSAGREERRIEQHADWVVGLAFNSSGTQFASASRDKTARLFDAGSGELEETYAGQNEPVYGVAFNQSGKLVLSGGRDRRIHAWSTNDAKRIFEIGGFEGDVLRLTVSDDQLFSCATDKVVRQHQLADKKATLERSYSGHRDVVFALAYDRKSKRLATGSFDGEVRVWNTENGEMLKSFIAAPGYRASRP